MADNWAAIAETIAGLIDEGTPYEAEVDPTKLNLPGFWVTPVSRNFDTLDGDRSTLIFDILAITNPRGGAVEALSTLSDMQAALRALPDPLNSQGANAEVVSIQLPNQAPDGLPALRIQIEVEDV